MKATPSNRRIGCSSQHLSLIPNVIDILLFRVPSLRKFKGTPNLRVVIGGGDGSINWVLSGMRAEEMTDVPAGCIPLGTGNDSSRAFGWFASHRIASCTIHRSTQEWASDE